MARTWWYWMSLRSMDTTTSFWVSSSFPASALLVPLKTKRSWTMGCRAGMAGGQSSAENPEHTRLPTPQGARPSPPEAGPSTLVTRTSLCRALLTSQRSLRLYFHLRGV